MMDQLVEPGQSVEIDEFDTQSKKFKRPNNNSIQDCNEETSLTFQSMNCKVQRVTNDGNVEGGSASPVKYFTCHLSAHSKLIKLLYDKMYMGLAPTVYNQVGIFIFIYFCLLLIKHYWHHIFHDFEKHFKRDIFKTINILCL